MSDQCDRRGVEDGKDQGSSLAPRDTSRNAWSVEKGSLRCRRMESGTDFVLSRAESGRRVVSAWRQF